MAYMNDPDGRLCGWGIMRSECWGVRLPSEYKGEVPPQMLMDDIPEAEYIVLNTGHLIMNRKTGVWRNG